MPQKYRIKLDDGREFDVTTEGGPPSKEDIMKALTTQPPESKPEPGLIKQAWTGATTPLVDIRGGPMMKEASEQFAKDYPVIGGIANFGADLLSSMTSPLNLAFGGLGTAEAVGAKVGLSAIPKIAQIGRRALSVPIVAEGAEQIYEGHPITGGIEVAGGLLGMKKFGGAKVKPTGVPITETPKPKMRANLDKTFTNVQTGEIFDKAGKKVGATTESLIAAIKASKPLNKEQAKIYTVERAEKFAKARTVDIKGEETANKFMGQLAGEHTKVTMEPLVPDDITLNSWYRIVGEHLKTNPEIDVPRAAQAIDAIKKMRDGSVPVKSQIETLEKIFPGTREALAGRAPSETSMFRQGYDISRSLMAIDPPFLTSAAFRQGAPYVGTKDWFKAWWTAAKSFKSQTLYDATMAKIDSMPLFKRTLNPTTRKFEPSYADKIGLRLSDMGAIRGREEIIRGSLVEKWPLIGRYVKANNRAYTAFLNDLRASRLNSIVKAAESNGLNPTKNLAWGKQAAEAINTLTGAGKLGIEIGPKQISVERSTKLLTDTLFAPRLIASRVRMLNPSTYIMANPMVRREYVKGLLRNVMAWWGIAELAEIGAGAIVSKDPSSADFGKIKIGNTRIDAGGGLQQYLVLGYRIPTALLGGKYTSSVSNKEYEYARGYKPETAFTTSMNFVINKLHPVLKLLVDIAAANENRPVNLADRVLQNYTPMISGDLLEVLREDPTLLPIVGLFGGTGMGAQTYEAGPQKSKIIPESWDLRIPSVR